ncbi:MAG: hypothetical protein IKV03_04580 [Alphaproteobacteria bacterium]|nr:hypothetical protein [Alphaproteobacteria bacterium]
MERHLTPQPERFWEKYAIVPFFMAFLSVGCTMGYFIAKEVEKEQKFYKEWYKERPQLKASRDIW